MTVIAFLACIIIFCSVWAAFATGRKSWLVTTFWAAVTLVSALGIRRGCTANGLCLIIAIFETAMSIRAIYKVILWNQVFKECTPVDLRTLDLQVETMFDEALKLFAQKTTNVLDFGCGTGDISFQYLQYQPTHKVLGIDASKTGIEFATETARLSDYKTATFLEGTDHTVKQLEENSFDGVILSNVLDVMPKDVSKEVVEDLERVLKPGGYWFIKMNPYYSKEELESFGYENMGNNIYEENHIMRLRQATTNYWKERFARFGKEIIYLEFEYPWQEGMNRLFVYQS